MHLSWNLWGGRCQNRKDCDEGRNYCRSTWPHESFQVVTASAGSHIGVSPVFIQNCNHFILRINQPFSPWFPYVFPWFPMVSPGFPKVSRWFPTCCSPAAPKTRLSAPRRGPAPWVSAPDRCGTAAPPGRVGWVGQGWRSCGFGEGWTHMGFYVVSSGFIGF